MSLFFVGGWGGQIVWNVLSYCTSCADKLLFLNSGLKASLHQKEINKRHLSSKALYVFFLWPWIILVFPSNQTDHHITWGIVFQVFWAFLHRPSLVQHFNISVMEFGMVHDVPNIDKKKFHNWLVTLQCKKMWVTSDCSSDNGHLLHNWKPFFWRWFVWGMPP